MTHTNPTTEYFSQTYDFFHIKRPSLNYQMRIRTSMKIVTITGNIGGSQSHASYKEIINYKRRQKLYFSSVMSAEIGYQLPGFGTG